jgi:membrane-bound ClpP family serine protease
MPILIILVAALPLAAAVFLAATLRHKKSAQIPLDVIGRVATVVRDLSPEGAVVVRGELLPARSRTGATISRASCVRVVGARGHHLEVEPEN